MQEGLGREGKEIPISPEQAGQLLDGFKLGGNARLPIGHGQRELHRRIARGRTGEKLPIHANCMNSDGGWTDRSTFGFGAFALWSVSFRTADGRRPASKCARPAHGADAIAAADRSRKRRSRRWRFSIRRMVRVGEEATYRITLDALLDSISLPEKLPVPNGLILRPSARGQVFRQVGGALLPHSAFNYRARSDQPGTFVIPEFTVQVYGQTVTVPPRAWKSCRPVSRHRKP